MVAEARASEPAPPQTKIERKRTVAVTVVLLAALAIVIGIVALKR